MKERKHKFSKHAPIRRVREYLVNHPDHVDVNTAAELLGLSRVTVQNMIKEGQLKCVGEVPAQNGATRFVEKEAVFALLKEVSKMAYHGRFDGVWVTGMTMEELIVEVKSANKVEDVVVTIESERRK